MKANTFAVELAMARKRKRLTQEEVCRAIGLSEPAVLSRWENGKEVPSKDATERIIKVYGDPILGYIYLQECDPVGRMVLPRIHRRDLGNAVLLLQKEHTDIHRIKDDLIEIACDGVIDEHEEDRWKGSMKEVEELASACIGLTLAQIKIPYQGGNLDKAYI